MTNKTDQFNLNIPDSEKPRLVIAGGGFGGINLLKKIDIKLFQVVIMDRYNYHTFQPLLYQVATAGLEPDSVAGPLRKIIRKNKEVFFRMLKVDSVDPKNNTLTTKAGILEFDFLVLATGSKINFFGNDQIARHAFPLKQITHALDLRSHILQQFEKLEISRQDEIKNGVLNFVIVGAGPTGVELCGALSELRSHVLPRDYPELDLKKMKIFLIEGLDRVLPAMSKKSSNRVNRYLEKMGVEIRRKTMTRNYDGKMVNLDSGENILTRTLIWAAGVKGNIPQGFTDENKENGKLVVNEFNQVIRSGNNESVYENIFAIGDVAFMKTKDYPEGLPGLAQPAIQQGKHLASNLSRIVTRKEMKSFAYKNKGVLATIGRNKAVAELPRNIWFAGFAGWLTWMMVHLLFLVGYRNRAIVFANWVWNYFTYDRSIRLILRPSSKDHDMVSHGMTEEMKESEN